MGILETGGNRTARLPTSIDRDLGLVMFSLLKGGDESRLNIGPGTVVKRLQHGGINTAIYQKSSKIEITYLLLGPDNVRIGVLVKVRSQKVIWQRRQLLNPRNSNIVDTSLFSLLEELEVDLTST